jgi:hypothetical protein
MIDFIKKWTVIGILAWLEIFLISNAFNMTIRNQYLGMLLMIPTFFVSYAIIHIYKKWW